MKTCRVCGVSKDESEFCIHRKNSDGRNSKCKPCMNAYQKATTMARFLRDPERERQKRRVWRERYLAKHPDRVVHLSKKAAEYKARLKAQGWWQNNNLKRVYGITLEDKKVILAASGGRCAICRIELPLLSKSTHADHDHKTGNIRGVLCRDCNHGLGTFKDSTELLRAAIQYLETLPAQWGIVA